LPDSKVAAPQFVDTNSDNAIDYPYASYDFNGSWTTITLGHDSAGDLADDGLYKYTYDAWNP
jgi:hypothetical protein